MRKWSYSGWYQLIPQLISISINKSDNTTFTLKNQFFSSVLCLAYAPEIWKDYWQFGSTTIINIKKFKSIKTKRAFTDAMNATIVEAPIMGLSNPKDFTWRFNLKIDKFLGQRNQCTQNIPLVLNVWWDIFHAS